MGCSSSVAPKHPATVVVTSEPSKQHHDEQNQTLDPILDSTQRRLIKDTWRQLLPLRANIGKHVCLRVFEEDPSLKEAITLGSAWGDKLINDDRFQKRAADITEAIVYCVEHVDLLDTKVGPHMMVVGASRVHMEGFTVRHFEVLVKPLMSVWQNELKDNFTPEVKHAWQTLFEYITQKSKEGYENAVKQNDAEHR